MNVPSDLDRFDDAIHESDLEALRCFDSTIAAEFLEHLMDSMENGPVDEDVLMSRGRLLAAAGHRSVDGCVIAWLRSAPSAARLDIASVVLWAIWGYGAPGTIDAAHVEALLDARRELASTTHADASSLFALVRALETALPETLAQRVMTELEAASRRPSRHPTITDLLKRVLAKRG
jgi:hypothetical protein